MASEYENLVRKSAKAQGMPLDEYYQAEKLFSGENPYSAQYAGPAQDTMSNEALMEKTSMPVDFSKSSLQQAAAPTEKPEETAVKKGSEALIAFGDPSMKALGLGLATAAKIGEVKRQNQIDRYNAEVKRIQARQDAINKMAQIGQGLRA